MAEILSEFEVEKDQDMYKGRINVGGFSIKYWFEKDDGDETQYSVKFSGKFYNSIPKRDFSELTKPLLEGIILCIEDYQKSSAIGELGLSFMDENKNVVKDYSGIGSYEMILRIPKRVKKTIRKAYLKKKRDE